MQTQSELQALKMAVMFDECSKMNRLLKSLTSFFFSSLLFSFQIFSKSSEICRKINKICFDNSKQSMFRHNLLC